MSELQNSINNHQNQLNNINSQINSLQDEQDLVQEKIDDLNAEIINTMTSIGMKEDEIAIRRRRNLPTSRCRSIRRRKNTILPRQRKKSSTMI